jgi:hypothetical protein
MENTNCTQCNADLKDFSAKIISYTEETPGVMTSITTKDLCGKCYEEFCDETEHVDTLTFDLNEKAFRQSLKDEAEYLRMLELDEMELKDECDLNAFEATLGQAE